MQKRYESSTLDIDYKINCESTQKVIKEQASVKGMKQRKQILNKAKNKV